MTQQWEFTDLEFRVLWDRYIDEESGIPTPLTYTCRTKYLDQYLNEKYRTWERLRDTVDPAIRELLQARPEVLVRVVGWYDQDRTDPKQWIRLRGIRSGMHGYVISQHPGETVSHSGGYTITECGPRAIAETVVRMLPQVEAGRRGSIPIVIDQEGDLEGFRSGGSLVTEEVDYSGARHSEQFLNTPASKTGAITVIQGHSKFGPRGVHRHHLVWRDLPDDGRYLIELPSDAPIAVGIGAGGLVAKINSSIENMLDRMETHWELHG
ncbi:ESX secretion-associated protein EspG [Nocardia sp. NPDC050710]|uniref:ESX secretion-associated protein EspG n=1 Tax=Nocardia sp. NPDC050710 TaxID=3157220 RepID=UPI0033DBFB5A